ncbi:conserved hypothetical protein [Nostocoides japonicum T1-X7]|uniref:Trypsin-co-occurring domain-containing protein n=1 Tax=Nostocoides japonicum T1-X7 TaxID=1194083 RepID=A0A077LWB6_9MICO|nr:trypco2 family protein [Tetrasphaera japonica]CCH76205.1 conserved hypothetical protein [Tetrasphaera japonica T1-X7]
MSDTAPIQLADAIANLRSELESAAVGGADSPVRFDLGPVSISFTVEVSRTAEGNAGVKFWVVSAGGSGSRTGSTTHEITLELHPVTASGDPLRISGRALREPREPENRSPSGE